MFVNTILVIASVLALGNANTNSQEVSPQPSIARFTEPVCGIYCVCESLKLLGQPVDINNFLTTEFAHRETGSSLEQLGLITRQFGKSIIPIQNLNFGNLESLDPPIIVLLENGPYGGSPIKHWILIVGQTDSSVLVKDSRVPGLTLEKAKGELLSEWGGKAFVLVDSSTGSTSVFLLQSFVSIVMPLSLAIFCGVLWRTFAESGRISQIGLGHVFIASVGVFLFNYFVVLRALDWPNQELATFITSKNEIYPFPEMSVNEFLEKKNSLLLVDARDSSQFEQFSLDNSINLPSKSSFSDFRKFKSEYDQGQEIVVYCASEKCLYADITASRLKSLGFINISIFRGGVNLILTSEKRKLEPVGRM